MYNWEQQKIKLLQLWNKRNTHFSAIAILIFDKIIIQSSVTFLNGKEGNQIVVMKFAYKEIKQLSWTEYIYSNYRNHCWLYDN